MVGSSTHSSFPYCQDRLPEIVKGPSRLSLSANPMCSPSALCVTFETISGQYPAWERIDSSVLPSRRCTADGLLVPMDLSVALKGAQPAPMTESAAIRHGPSGNFSVDAT